MNGYLSRDTIYRPITSTGPFSMTSYGMTFPTPSTYSMDFCNSVFGPRILQLDPDWGTNYMRGFTANSTLQDAVNSLNQLEYNTKGLLNDERLNESQKTRLQEILDEINELKEKVENAAKLEGSEKLAAAETIKEEIATFIENVKKTTKDIADELAEAAEEGGSGSTGGSTGGSAGGSTVGNQTGFDKETGRALELGDKPTKSALRELNSKLFFAIDGPGTEYSVLKDIIITNGAINAGNIIELIDNWEAYYGEKQLNDLTKLDFSNFDDKDNSAWDQTFINRFVEDLGHDEKKEFVPYLLNALITRAEAAGVPEEKFSQYVSKINNELGDWCIGEKEIVKGLLGIYKEIKIQEQANATDETTKQNNKIAEEKKQAEATFLRDMRKEWNDNELETSNNITYEDGLFKITIEGVEYKASSFKRLCKKLTEAGLDPKDYFTKELDTNA